MTAFEFIGDKGPSDLQPEDCFIHEDRFWRVIENYAVLGYPTHRMLVILPYQATDQGRYKFFEIRSEARIGAYKKTE